MKEYYYFRSVEMKNNLEKINLFKDAMANYPTGVNVITTTDKDGVPYGLTVNSFASVSLDPLLVLWSIDHGVSTYDVFSETEKYAVNILGGEQTDLAWLFAGKEENRFEHCDWKMSAHELPIIDGVIATLECKLYKKVIAGDHLIMIGEVIDIHAKIDNPLLYHGRKLAAFPTSYHDED